MSLEVEDVAIGVGLVGIIMFALLIIFIPMIATIVLGVAIANMLGFTGIVWWSFLIVFYLVIMGIIGLLSNIKP